MKIASTVIPQISQSFTQISAEYIFNNGVRYVNHSVEWITPFKPSRDNTWELNCTINDLSVNVKAIGTQLYVDGIAHPNFGLRSTIAKKFALSHR